MGMKTPLYKRFSAWDDFKFTLLGMFILSFPALLLLAIAAVLIDLLL